MGRHTEFTQEIAASICERLGEGESLRSICADDSMPTKSTVFKWLVDFKSFADQYAHARETQANVIFDEIVAISEEECADAVAVNRNRLRVDARKWVAGKLRPKVYGDKLELSGDPQNPLVTVIERKIIGAGKIGSSD